MPAPLTFTFNQGLDTRADPKPVSAPFLAQAGNVYFAPDASMRKRNGYYTLTKNVVGGGTISNGTNLTTFNNELLLFDDQRVYSWSPMAMAWATRDYYIPTTVTTDPAPTGHAYDVTSVQYVRTANYDMYVYGDAVSNTLYLTLADIQTGAVLVQDTALTATAGATTFRLVRGISGALLFYSAGPGTALSVVYLSPVPSAPVSAPKQLTASANAFDASFDGTAVVAAWQETAAPQNVRISSYNENLTNAIGYYGSLIAGNNTGVQNVSVACSPVQQKKAWIFYGGSGAYFPNLNTPDTRAFASPTVTIGGDYPRVSACMEDTSTRAHVVFGIGSPSIVTDNQTFYANTDAPTNTKAFIDMVPVTGPFVVNGDAYSWLGYCPTYYALNNTTGPFVKKYTAQRVTVLYNWSKQRVVAKMGYGLASYTKTRPVPIASRGSNTFAFPFLRTTSNTVANNTLTPINSAYMATLRFCSAYELQNAKMGGQQLFAGGIVTSYDGSRLTEHGFTVAPDITGLSDVVTNYPVPTYATTCLYVIVWEWTDAQGQVHRSAPSAPFTYTRASGTAYAPLLYFTPLQLSSKVNVQAVLYKTANNGQVYYRVAASSAQSKTTYSTSGGTAQDYCVIDKTLNDAAVQSGDILYTVGGELPNDAPPGCTLMASGITRVYLGGGETRDQITYSKEQVQNLGLGFSLALTKQANQNPGPITGIATQDDKVVFWKQRSLFYFSGNGPTANGQNDDFSPAYNVSNDVGCTSAQSIARLTDGIIFQSEKGLYQVGRDLGINHIGAPISTLEKGAIATAVVVPALSQVRFGSATAAALVYHNSVMAQYPDQNVVAGRWTMYHNYRQQGACLWQGAYTFARSDGTVCVENAGYRDAQEPIPITLQTGWIRPAGPLEAGKNFELAIMGLRRSAHILQMDLTVDYMSVTAASVQIDAQAATVTSTWGSGPFGSGTWGGDADDAYLARVMLPIQQSGINAVQLTLRDMAPSGVDLQESLTLGAVTMTTEATGELAHVGLKKYYG